MLYRINAGRIPQDHWVQDSGVGGGRIIGEVCHFIDCMQTLCGALPISVFARRIGRHSSGLTDDQCSISLRFADGPLGTIVYTAAGDPGLPKEHFEAHTDGKSVTMDDFMETQLCVDSQAGKRISRRDDFVQAVERNLPPPMRFEEIEAVTLICLLAVRSLQSGSVYDL